ncbi:hypothetical protein DRH14_02360 [Candidatus Shapirobacteria bacterium]|nr:MAG: hypothetical protein DRH14_02360 [Candidatus Shapirobacteria bacterium]
MFQFKQIPKPVIDIIQKFNQHQAEIYIVGGAVRDLILNQSIHDWDFATNLTTNQMHELFPKNSFCNNNYGTFSIVGPHKQIFEITTYRKDEQYSDSRHPSKLNWGKSIKEDLGRRDFTVNTIALKINLKNKSFQLIDPFNGQQDIKNKIIRSVGNASDRFSEDALRMLRAVRLACQLSFVIEDKTFSAIQKQAHLLSNIAGERIRDELFKILLSSQPAFGMVVLKNANLLEIIMPELLIGIDFQQKGHHVYNVWEHNLRSMQNCQTSDPITKLAALLHDVAKPIVAQGKGEARTFYNHEVVGSRIAVKIGKRLKLSNQQLDKLFRLVRWHMFTCQTDQSDRAIRRFIRRVTPDYLDDMIALRRGDRLGSGSRETSWRWELFKKRLIEVQKQPFKVTDLKINGRDVMQALNLKPGPKIGQILDKLFKQVEGNPKLNQRHVLLEKLEEI